MIRRLVLACACLAAAAAAPQPAPPPGARLDADLFTFSRRVPSSAPRLSALTLDAHVLSRSRRFDDVRLLDGQGRQVPYLLERREEPLAIELPLAPHQPAARELQPASAGRRSVYLARLPFPGLPPARLVLETPARLFTRTVRIGFDRAPDRQRREPWFEQEASGIWQHAGQDGAAPPLVLPVSAGADQDVVIVVDEGDNRPLPIASARLLLPSYRLRFQHPGGPLRLVYGNADLAAPQYDLALLAPSVMEADAVEVAAEAAEGAPGNAAARPSIVSPAMFWAGLSVAVLVLLVLIVTLLRRA